MAQIGIKLASATLLAAPIMVAYIFFQRYFIQSMATAGQKE
jgi:ABC-type glycerol-3-phosphate transport system permease component